MIECGSFSAASERLNVSVTTVARQINSLEDRLGVKLLNRSTRALSLTEAGVLYSERIRSLMHEFDAIKREVSSYQRDVKGLLRVHLRHSIGSHVIVPALPQFLQANPEIKLDVTLTDSLADLVTHKVDVAVWLGELPDSGLIARKLRPGRRVICCSPAYAKAFGMPATPEELAQHNCIVYRAKNYDSVWRVKSKNRTISVNVSGNLQTESSAVTLIASLNGVGLAMLQEVVANTAIASGELINVFPGCEVSSTDTDVALYAVYSGRKKTPPKTEAFVEFLVRLFRNRST